MHGELTDVLRRSGLPLGDLIEDGPGFRIGRPGLPFVPAGGNANTRTYADRDHSLEVESRVDLYGTAVAVSHRLENTGSRPSPPIDAIEPLYVVFRRPAGAWRHVFANGGTTEYHYPPTAFRTHEWSRASRDGLTVESHPGGRSSDLHLPFLISLASTGPGSAGLFCGMEWSAGWYIRFEAVDELTSSLAVGIKVNGLRLEPGESLRLPAVHLGFFEGGPAAGTNALRRHLYEAVCARYRDRPVVPRVSYAHWDGIGDDFDDDLLKAEAKRAAELGVEVFAVDASWFPGDFPHGVGNWDDVDRRKLPDGLEPLAAYVRELGMDLGLWFEPERAAHGTSVHRQHPEWFVAVDRRDGVQDYHLNLANRQAQDYVIDMVGGWIERLDLRWTRWDYNVEPGPFWDAADPTLKVQFGYVEGLYRVLDTLMKDHPGWMVEGCAGGGRRIDMGMMRRAHTFSISDQMTDPLACRYMQARANRFLPGQLVNGGLAVGLGRGDAGFDDTAMLSRMLGGLSFEGDIASWSPGLTARMARWVGEYKAVRHLVVQDFYQLMPMPTTVEDWDAVQFVGHSGDEATLFVFAGEGGGRRAVRLQGLEQDREYDVSRRPDGRTQRLPGSEMLADGLSVELGPYEGGLWRIARAR